MSFLSGSIAALVLVCQGAPAAEWIKPSGSDDPPKWGLKGGLQFALHPSGFTGGEGGPRGLIRLGYPTLPDGGYDLINFIAVEPLVAGKKGFSELEKSTEDGRDGKIFRPSEASAAISSLGEGVEELSVTVLIEKFRNGAHMRLKLSQRSDAPDELKLTVFSEPDSAPVESCILTATMGNKARTRLLTLADARVSSLDLYPGHRGPDFTSHKFFGLERLARTPEGDVIAAITTDEENPANVRSGGFWDYKGHKVTQYWRKAAADVTPQLACVVNGRYTYWMSERPIPGGVAFENFELREPFKSGQSLFFGITRKPPESLIKP